MPFSILGGQLFPSSSYHLWEPSIVFETVLFLCQVFLNLSLLFTNFRQWPFFEIFASDLYNKWVAKTNHLQKKMKTKAETSKMALPIQHGPGYALSSMKCAFFMLINYAVGISFRTIKLFKVEHNLFAKKKHMLEDFLWKKSLLTILGYWGPF